MPPGPGSARKVLDAVVVGSGPNGLAAAIVLARAGLEVELIEGSATIGGGMRSAERTLPGFVHDVCSAVHPMAVASPFFRSLPLQAHGLEWVHAPLPLAHPLDGGGAAALERSLDATAEGLGADGASWRQMMRPGLDGLDGLLCDILAPPHLPRHPLRLARFGLGAIRPARALARGRFAAEPARALFAGLAAHTGAPLERWGTSAIGIVLGLLGHAVGWPVPRGGAQRLADALAAHLVSLGGRIEVGRRVASLADLPPARAVLLDVTPRQLIAIAGSALPSRYVRRLERWRYGPGVFKVDWALSAPIPWTAEACRRACVVHVGGTLDEVAEGERAPWEGRLTERPFVLVAQPSLFDDRRAPAGKQTAWAYCRVPHAASADMTVRIEDQIERFAPGFRDVVLARSTIDPAGLEAMNPNLVGGDIAGGAMDLAQMFSRPVLAIDPYATPHEGLYLCSSSTPPGGGVHGMCGVHAARAALRRTFGR